MDKYIPTNLAMTVYDIDFATLYANGARVILFDLDNTLASYDETTPTKKQLELNEKLRKMGYKIFIISNNRKPRTYLYTRTFQVDDYLVLSKKPFLFKIKKFLKKHNIKTEEIVMIGDQMLTDICCANRLGVKNIMVKSISRKTERWYTRINRLREKMILKKIAKKDAELAQKIKKYIGEQGDGKVDE